jgi:hypothetical protein
MKLQIASFILCTSLLMPSASVFAEQEVATETFALIIGANKSIDEELKPLKYADDDAARYFDLMQALGARTYLLARLDQNTARLHPRAAAEAQLPGGDELAGIVGLLKGNIRLARERGAKTVLYFIYAGHGNMKDGRGYITLENSRIYGPDVLSQIVDPISADNAHLIIDACYSFFLAYGRGAGGSHRKVEKLDGFQSLSKRKNVGLLLSTSSAAESHEWESFQSGVFSHEIRSGLYGAADANGDGAVSYREIAAFVELANRSIPNEKYRPKLHARPPPQSEKLMDLNKALARHIEVDGQKNGHYLLEDESGVRLLDFHNGKGHTMKLVRSGQEMLFLRNLTTNIEYELPPSQAPIRIASLAGSEPQVQDRGAAHHSFKKLFQEPFDESVVDSFAFKESAVESTTFSMGSLLGIAALGGGAMTALAAVAAVGGAAATYATATPEESQSTIAMRNYLILGGYGGAAGLLATSSALATTGFIVLLWPSDRSDEASANTE